MLKCPISANDDFSENLRKYACVSAAMQGFKIQNCQKIKGRASKLELKFPIRFLFLFFDLSSSVNWLYNELVEYQFLLFLEIFYYFLWFMKDDTKWLKNKRNLWRVYFIRSVSNIIFISNKSNIKIDSLSNKSNYIVSDILEA